MKSKIACVLGFLIVIWFIEILNVLLGNWINDYLYDQRIHPRTMRGLVGPLIAPFFHGSLNHLAGNTIPFIVLSGLVILRGAERWIFVSIVIIILGGLGVWLIGRPAIHIGASGLVFGYFGYLVASGWYDRKISSILISIAVIIFYGGMLFGILPTKGFVSWEAHLCGLIAGVIAARLMRQKRAGRRK